MEDNGCAPNQCTYNTITRGFLRGKDVRKALELLRTMRSKKFDADAHTTSLFRSLFSDRCGHAACDSDEDLLRNVFKI
ncbi:hypothetical protein BVRB_4g076630 [Beta vulgaris subsp. vulgaris]|nr:hypothetical protein BVRB_4g076630 [Beta vulgaris subsp. vulgaris]